MFNPNQNPNATSIQVVSYAYNGNPVTFKVNGNVMINATKMAKPFEKRPVDWLRFDQSQEFISELSKVRNHTLIDLVQVRKGGSNPGTWMHEDVALEFARWLSPAFAIWCNDRIKEILLERMNGKKSSECLSGQYIQVTGADDNLYILSVFKAFRELIDEDINGNICAELRFSKKYEAAQLLFPEHRENLKNASVKM